MASANSPPVDPAALRVPSSYSRLIARELGLQERELLKLLRGSDLPVNILFPGDGTTISAQQQMTVLENALQISAAPEFGLRLGQRLQPSSHGPMGYLVLSSPDVISALESFADYLPLRFPFSSVVISRSADHITCTLALKIEPSYVVKRILQECFALMLQAVVESLLGRPLTEARIGLQHTTPGYVSLYDEYFHTKVSFSEPMNTFRIPAVLAGKANIAGHSASYAAAQKLCTGLLEQFPVTPRSTADRVRRLLLSSPMGSQTIDDVASAMFVTTRTLQRRLAREGTSYRELTDLLGAELAARHLLDPAITVEAIAVSLGYFDSAAFRKAFHRWYGVSPQAYRAGLDPVDSPNPT